MEELIDALDKFGNKTGIIKRKSEIKKDGDYHRAISVLIINDNNEILMQKRSQNKKFYPNLWSLFVKGHIQSKEDPISACIREIKEELGIIVREEELKYLYTIKEEKRENDYIENIFFDTYILKKNIDLKKVIIEKDELSDVKYITVSKVLKLIKKKDKSLAPNKQDYEIIFKKIKTIN